MSQAEQRTVILGRSEDYAAAHPGDPAPAPAALSPALADYHFLKFLGRNPLGDVWKARAADGRLCSVLFVSAEAYRDPQALDRLTGLSHPTLPALQVVWCDSGHLALITEHHFRTLRDRFHDCWNEGLSGIPQSELLEYLRVAAEALDILYIDHQVQHMALSPLSLVLKGDRLLVRNFGLAQLLWLPSGQLVTDLSPRYTAPELSRGHFSCRCDQYSLALIYAEMRTGIHPVRPHVRGRTDSVRRDDPLDLRLLSATEREVLSRALSDRSHDRFATCTDLVRALEVATKGSEDRPPSCETLPLMICSTGVETAVPGTESGGPSLDSFLGEVTAFTTGASQIHWYENIRYLLRPGSAVEHHLTARLSPRATLQGLEGFQRQWLARLVRRENDLMTFLVPAPSRLWHRLLGRRVGLMVAVNLFLPLQEQANLTEIVVTIQPSGCDGVQAVHLLEQLGPPLLASLRSLLHPLPEARTQERVLCSQPLRITPVLAGLQFAEVVEAVGKDISANGVGFFLRDPLPTQTIYVNLPWLRQFSGVAVRAQVVRGEPCGGGWYEVGAFFSGEGQDEANEAV